MIITCLPDWIQKYKESRTEIKRIKNDFYKYEVVFVYGKEKTKNEKKTIRLNVYLDFIGGIRIWKFQLSAGVNRGLILVTINDEFDWKIRQNRNLIFNLGVFF